VKPQQHHDHGGDGDAVLHELKDLGDDGQRPVRCFPLRPGELVVKLWVLVVEEVEGGGLLYYPHVDLMGYNVSQQGLDDAAAVGDDIGSKVYAQQEQQVVQGLDKSLSSAADPLHHAVYYQLTNPEVDGGDKTLDDGQETKDGGMNRLNPPDKTYNPGKRKDNPWINFV